MSFRVNSANRLIVLALAMFLSVGATSAIADAGGGSFSKLGDAKEAIKKEDYEAAIAELDRLNKQDSGDADVLNLLGYSYRKLEKFDKALNYYQQALKADPKHKGAHEYLGELYLQINQLEKAKQQLAVLDDICTLTCGEYRDLRKSIKKHKQNQ